MKIGYSVEGSTDRAFLSGLKRRWCSYAEMVEGRFRGSTQESQRRELRKICLELDFKSVDLIIFLLDGNGTHWRTVDQQVKERMPKDALHKIVIGVPDRNVERWICHDPNYIAEVCGGFPGDYLKDDPKAAFEAVMGISRDDKKEAEIENLVANAPIWNWLSHESFNHFYETIRDLSQQRDCTIKNERDRVRP